VFIILFPNFESPEKHLAEVLPEKIAVKLMNEADNLFENFIEKLYLKFGRIQINGFHNRNARTVNPRSRQQALSGFNVSANDQDEKSTNKAQNSVVQ